MRERAKHRTHLGEQLFGMRHTSLALSLLEAAVAISGCGSSTSDEPSPDAGPSTDGSIATSVLGATCGSDGDCGSGFNCALPPGKSLYGGAPARGYCTRACDGIDDSSCVAYGGLCENVAADSSSPSWRCLEICSPGGKTQDAHKCHGRSDSACQPVDVQLDDALGPLGLCYPVCSSDTDCGASAYCAPEVGVCTDEKPTGDDFGASCTPDSSSCAGDCVGYSDDQGHFAYGFCSAPCAYGVDGACSRDGWVCAFGDASTLGAGDGAHCQPKCETDADCTAQLPADTKLHCDRSTVATLGYAVCAWGVPLSADAGPAPDAGTDASTVGGGSGSVDAAVHDAADD